MKKTIIISVIPVIPPCDMPEAPDIGAPVSECMWAMLVEEAIFMPDIVIVAVDVIDRKANVLLS